MDRPVGPILFPFEQFGAIDMHNHDATFPVRPGFEPGTSRLQASVDSYLKFRELDVPGT